GRIGGRRYHARSVLDALFVDAEEAADGFDHGHVPEGGDGVLNGGFAGDVGGEHDLRAGDVVAEYHALLLDDAGQADAAIAQDGGDGGHDAGPVQRQKTQEVARLQLTHRPQIGRAAGRG